jgi:hydrogenase/urease accessory protein HupE
MSSALVWAHGVSAADQAAILAGGNYKYFKLGAKHMLTGYDHLLFLFAVMFFLTRIKDVVRLVTAFTLGHSITLLGATLVGVTMNYYLIDAVIALTVCYKGFDNLDGFRRYLDLQPPSLTAAVFVFGLIHGFGLSTRLQQLPLPTEGLVARILSFNLGVEAGQMAALIFMLVLLAGWRHTTSFARFSFAANSGLVAAGALLLLMQLHSYSHVRYPGDFGFNYDAHEHAHEAARK